MADVTVDRIALDMWHLDAKAFLTSATSVQTMPNGWNLIKGSGLTTDNVNTFLGSNLTYTGNRPNGGVFDQWINDDYTAGVLTGEWEVSGFSLDARQLGALLAAGKAKDMFAMMLDGKDTLTGGIKDDLLDGFDGNDTVTGGAGNDKLYGGAGADRLSGGEGNDIVNGGAGTDKLFGNTGADRFVFDQKTGNANADVITDFNPRLDLIRLDDKIFTALDSGVLSADAFHAGSAAQHAGDHIIYDGVSGRLYYDADGAGGAAKSLIATLANTPDLTAADIVIF